jgi:molybdate transport system substrate-binding protein
MKRMLLLLALALLGGCHARTSTDSAAPDARAEITVSAAVSLKDAFDEIGRLYAARTGAKVNFNFGASGIMQKQIEQAAPVDVFASAGEKQMDELATKGLLLADTRRDFARNTLMLVVPVGAQTQLSSFEQLAQPAVRRIAVGNPKTVPAGQYTEQLLTNLKLWEQVQPKLVLAEDVRQVLDYVTRGEVEAGIVYASDVAVAKDRVTIAARAPAGTHDPILYPIAVIKDSQHAAAAKQFVDLVLSPEGQSILTKYGFLSVSR